MTGEVNELYFQSDYILRMIEMMGQFFKNLLEILDETMRHEEYDRIMRRQCGIDLKTAESLSADSLIDLLPDMPRFALSELCYLKTQAFDLSDEEAADCHYKALRLLLSVGKENLLCELRRDRLLQLYNETYFILSPDDMIEVFNFLLLADDYAHAEDVLFDAAKTTLGEKRAQLLLKGITAFEALDRIASDKELEAGNLPREELKDAIDELKRLQELKA